MSNKSIIKTPSFDSLKHAAKTFDALDGLSAEREAWEMTEYVGSTKRLYNLLAKVYPKLMHKPNDVWAYRLISARRWTSMT